jgi:WD40 repeat protein
VLGSLLDDDGLVSESEERVLKGVVRWMQGEGGGVIRGESLLRKIRFPFMSTEFLADVARGTLPDSTGLEGLVLESEFLKSMAANLWAGQVLRYLDAAVLVPRRRMSVNWADYAGGGKRRLAAGQSACSVSAHGKGFVCGGLLDGSIWVWNRATLEVERTLAGHTGAVFALVSVEGWLVSGSHDHGIRAWDVATGRCEGTLAGHTGGVSCLAESGGRLVSGSYDETAKVWRMEGAVSTWRCERTLAGHRGAVYCVAMLGGKVASGSHDKTIRVWDVGAGTHEQTLAGHAGAVVALVACGQRLISSSMDQTVKVWSMATWACVQTVQAYPAGSALFIFRLAVSEPTLVGGSFNLPHSATEEHEVRVWDLETLEPLHTLRQPAGQRVLGLVSDGGEVWGAVGTDVVVWGRRG